MRSHKQDSETVAANNSGVSSDSAPRSLRVTDRSRKIVRIKSSRAEKVVADLSGGGGLGFLAMRHHTD
jgi:hypothetical protein